MRSRAVRLLTLLSLLVAPLAVASSTESAQADDPGQYLERWCGVVPVVAPCLISVKRNGVPLTESDSQFEVQSTGQLVVSGFNYFGFLVAQAPGGTTTLALTDTWEFLFDTGGIDPTYSEAFAGRPDVDRFDDGDGTYKVRYTAKPILYTTGCDQTAAWPYPCPATADTEEIKLQVEVQDRNDEFARFHRSQSPESVNGIFLETAADGSRYLSSEMVNSHFRLGGTAVYEGEVRFRIPYTMLRDSFGVPDPSTMVAASLSGTVNGSTTAATFAVVHDPDGGGMIVDITDLTFSLKRIRVKRGLIIPTRPTSLRATRTFADRGRVGFTLARPRGAKPTGYVIRCVSAGGHVRTNRKTEPTSPIRVAGLRRGVAYSCRVRATSRAGYGTWSFAVRMPARP